MRMIFLSRGAGKRAGGPYNSGQPRSPAMKFSRRTFAVLVGIALVSSASFVVPSAQVPTKRPISYDAYDSWRAIAGTRLSEDGQWLAYALTSQGEDGTLIVRNLRSN